MLAAIMLQARILPLEILAAVYHFAKVLPLPPKAILPRHMLEADMAMEGTASVRPSELLTTAFMLAVQDTSHIIRSHAWQGNRVIGDC
jgi:hypothetical protein